MHLQNDLLDLIERDLIAAPIVELRSARAFVRRHLLGVFEESAVFEVDGDAGRAEGVAPKLGCDASRPRSAPDHTQRVGARHAPVGELPGPTGCGREEASGLVAGEPGVGEIGVHVGFEQVMGGHVMALAAFFVEPHPRAPSLDVVVGDSHADRRGDAGEGVDQQGNERPVAQPDRCRDIDAVEKLARLISIEHRGLAFLDDMLRAAHRRGWVDLNDLADDEPVKEHANRRQVLLNGWGRVAPAEQLDIGRDVVGTERPQRDALYVAPGAEGAYRNGIGGARVRVPDLRREEIDERVAGALATVGDEGRHDRHRADDRRQICFPYPVLGVVPQRFQIRHVFHRFSVS